MLVRKYEEIADVDINYAFENKKNGVGGAGEDGGRMLKKRKLSED